jgi:hypothetical protein
MGTVGVGDNMTMTFINQTYQRADATSTSRIRYHGVDIREAVSDRGRDVRSRGVDPPTRGAPEKPTGDDLRWSTWFP